MKKILIPVDFSDLSDYAYAVASKIAKETGAEITVLSIVPGPPGAVYTMSGELTNDEGNDYTEWNKKLEQATVKLNEWISDKSDIVTFISVIADIDEAILNISELHEIDLIIMGSEGEHSKSNWSKGSHTEYITGHSEVPVISLKCNRDNINLNQIVLVGDFLETKKINLRILKDIQEAYNSTLILLKVNTPSQVRSDEVIRKDMEVFAEMNGLTHFEMCIYKDNSVEAGIAKYTAEADIDLIAMGTHQKHGFSKLFRGSISEDVVNHLYHPILTFPI